MRKSLTIIVIIGLLFGLSACKPKDMSDTSYKVGIAALKAVDRYLDADIMQDELLNKLDELSKRIDGKDDALTFSVYITGIQVDFLGETVNDDAILEDRNGLAKALNQSER